MQGHYGSAIAHVTSGVKILCDIQCDEHNELPLHHVLTTSATPYVQIKDLKVLFTRLDTLVTQVRAFSLLGNFLVLVPYRFAG